MGGLGPGIGGLEILVIGLLALIVVGPKDLPLLMRKVGQALGKARAMANEFRSSFDEMARQSELDELRKEVDALRRGQGIVPLGAEAEAAFKDISAELNHATPVMTPALPGPAEWPESTPTANAPAPETPVTAVPEPPPEPKAPRAKSSARSKKAASVPLSASSQDAPAGSETTGSAKTTRARPASRKKVASK